MYRTELINYLARLRNAKRYLEIGVGGEEQNFAQVGCERKVGVDPRPVTTFQGTSDDFFAQNEDEFDIIFIDGLHTEEQVSRDIANAYRCLATGGIILLHDCMPPDAWHQREPEAFQEGESWNGTVWKAVLREFNRAIYKCTLLDMDWGCGLIDTAKRQVPVCRALPDELDYEQHYAWLLEYRTSVADYIREQVKVFYHLACMGNWQQVFVEQLQQLQQSGFYRIDLTVLGSDEDLRWAHSTCSEWNIWPNLVFHAPELTYFERPALLAVQEYARQAEGYVLYLHSKGVSSPNDETKAKWRRLMMRELVENWDSCVMQLPYYDVIGVNWREMGPISHFCGNFWYASTRYLRTLADFQSYYDNPRYPIWDAVKDKRSGCEFWIGSGKETPALLSLVCSNVDFCKPDYWG
jgi:SAM-dependent methyltransferase